jgi:DNA-binding response OmpR family regulator
VKIVKNIEELKNIDPKDFQPDLIILDVNVPDKEGEEPKNNSRLSSAIVKEKFSNVPVFIIQ